MSLGTREDGSVIQANDPCWPVLTKTAEAAKTAPRRWLEMEHIYGDLATEERFAAAFGKRRFLACIKTGLRQPSKPIWMVPAPHKPPDRGDRDSR